MDVAGDRSGSSVYGCRQDDTGLKVGIECDSQESALAGGIDVERDEGVGEELPVFDHADGAGLLTDEEAAVGGEFHRGGGVEPGGEELIGEAGGTEARRVRRSSGSTYDIGKGPLGVSISVRGGSRPDSVRGLQGDLAWKLTQPLPRHQ